MHQCGFVRHSVNPSVSQLDTINMHRHQLNCISFIAKQQQLLANIRWAAGGDEEERRQLVWSFTSLCFYAQQRKKQKTEKQAQNKANRTYNRNAMRNEKRRQRNEVEGARRCSGMPRWKLPLSQVGKGGCNPLLALSILVKQWEQWLKKGLNTNIALRRGFCVFLSPVFKSNCCLKLWATPNDLQIAQKWYSSQ